MNNNEDNIEILKDVVSRGRVALVALGSFFGFIVLSTIIFCNVYDWTVTDALYFTIMTFLTVGLGDLSPSPYPANYMVLVWLFLFLGLGVTAALVSAMSDPKLNLVATLRSTGPIWYVYKKFKRYRNGGPLSRNSIIAAAGGIRV